MLVVIIRLRCLHLAGDVGDAGFVSPQFGLDAALEFKHVLLLLPSPLTALAAELRLRERRGHRVLDLIPLRLDEDCVDNVSE